MCLRWHFFSPRKGQNKSGKDRFARGKMEVFRNIFYAFADNLIQRERQTKEETDTRKCKDCESKEHEYRNAQGTYHINNQYFT